MTEVIMCRLKLANSSYTMLNLQLKSVQIAGPIPSSASRWRRLVHRTVLTKPHLHLEEEAEPDKRHKF